MPTMKAIQIHRFGGEEVLQLDDNIEIPEPGTREIVIKAEASCVNHSDLWIRENGNIHIGPGDLPLILGREVAGTIVDVGSNVKDFKIGQRVVSMPAPQTRAAGLPGGKEYACCYAEYVLSRPQDCWILPDGIDMATGAAASWCCLTAWYVLRNSGLKKGDTILIHAGASAVGNAAIQFAKQMGTTVITTCGTAEKCARVLGLGADFAINYRQQDFEAEVMKVTGGKGLDVVIDTVGGETQIKSLRTLLPGGRLMVLGSLGGGLTGIAQDPPEGRTSKRFSITALLLEETNAIAKMEDIFQDYLAGKFQIIVDRVYPLAEVAAAHRYIDEGKNFGKVVLSI